MITCDGFRSACLHWCRDKKVTLVVEQKSLRWKLECRCGDQWYIRLSEFKAGRMGWYEWMLRWHGLKDHRKVVYFVNGYAVSWEGRLVIPMWAEREEP